MNNVEQYTIKQDIMEGYEDNSSNIKYEPLLLQIKQEPATICAANDDSKLQLKEVKKTESDVIESSDCSAKQYTLNKGIMNTYEGNSADISIDVKYEPLRIKKEPPTIPEPEEDSDILLEEVKVESYVVESTEYSGYLRAAEERKCDICGERFIDRLDFLTHRYTHTEDTCYTCCICNCNTFRLKPDMHRHMLNVHFNQTTEPQISARLNTPTPSNTTEKPYQCVICHKRFTRNYTLTAHNRIHSGEKLYQCVICHKQFTRNYTLTAHIRLHSGEKPYQCDICHKRFTTSDHLTLHIRNHFNDKPYECDICHKRFARRSELVVHKRIHTGEKRYECDTCHQTFTQNGSLNIHKRSHTGERPYECDTCHKCFAQSSSLNAHKRVHTGEKPYKCGICHYTFAQRIHLVEHKRIHTAEEPYKT